MDGFTGIMTAPQEASRRPVRLFRAARHQWFFDRIRAADPV